MLPYLVLDTNILLLDANNLINLGHGHTIVIPESVMDEIDSKKSSPDPELRFQVRALGRMFTRGTDLPQRTVGSMTITPIQIEDVIVELVSCSNYPDFSDLDPSIRMDRRIIHIANLYHTNFGNTTFMTNDIMCGFRAKPLGLTVTSLRIVEDKPLEFTRSLAVDPETFSSLHNTPILDIDPAHLPENYNYLFTDTVSGQVKLANIRNGLIDILGKETEAELRKQDAVPQNAGHLFMSRAIQNPNIDIVVADSQAGTGKTLTAFSNAIQLIKRKEYGGIVYFRTTIDDVEKAEQQGFRSGNDEKIAPFFGPVEDTLDFIARRRHSDSRLKGRDFEDFIAAERTELRERYHIEESTNLGLRGRTFSNIVAIIDEAQNYSKPALQKLLTRFGKDCKLILIGSQLQIDHPYDSRHTNGLSVIMSAATESHDLVRLHAVKLDKVLRSPLSEWAEYTFAKGKL